VNIPPCSFRKAASVLVVRGDPIEVLMVRRNAQAAFAASYVFPGGVVDLSDGDDAWLRHVKGADDLSRAERANRIAACRETFEEASILLTVENVGGAVDLELRKPARSFFQTVQALDVQLDLAALQPFAHWITPATVSKRFDTRFYLVEAPSGQHGAFDSTEVDDLMWTCPLSCVDEAVAGKRLLYFPTLVNLERLAESTDVVSAKAAARLRDPFTVTPAPQTRSHGAVFVIPAAAGYARTEFPIQSQ
jgi:8-oxo-dGTP pyrophosphatase MutT (NUDIX family)